MLQPLPIQYALVNNRRWRWIGFMLAATVGSLGSQVIPCPTFEAASVKSTRDVGFPKLGAPRIRTINGGRFVAETVSLSFLIRLAYKVMEAQILEEPAWANSALFEIDAKAATNASLAEMRPMIRSLLADRFKLVIHRETKEMPVYELVAGKGGIRISHKEGTCVAFDPGRPPSALRPGETHSRTCGDVGGGTDFLEGYGVSIPALVEALSDTVERKVIDKTGFAGTFDFHMTFTRDEVTGNGTNDAIQAAGGDGPSIFTALQEQLGLRLKPAKDPVEVLVIDHAERPAEN